MTGLNRTATGCWTIFIALYKVATSIFLEQLFSWLPKAADFRYRNTLSYIHPEDHEEYLHTLGNLTVTGYNSELSNKGFAEKRDIIRENSKAVVLNCDVLDKNSWGVTDIQARAKRLAGIVLTRYRIKRVVDESIEFEYIETLTLNNYDAVTGKKLVSFKLFGETYRQNKYALMLLDVIKLLDKKKPGKLQMLAENNYSFNASKRKHVHLNVDGADMRLPWKVTDGVYRDSFFFTACVICGFEGHQPGERALL